MVTLSEIKRKNKEAGQYFFERGKPPVIAKYGNYLVTRGMGEGYVIYKYDESNAHINLVDNKSGEYAWQPYATKEEAIKVARSLK